MRSFSNVMPSLPGLGAVGQSFAPWPVWRGSTRADVQFFATVSKRKAVHLYHRARRFERQTRTFNRQDGVLGRNGLAVLHALLFDFLNYTSGRLDPSYARIAEKAAISERSVARGLVKLRLAGVLKWLRRCREDHDADGRFRLRQESNAYAVLPATQWRGFIEPPEPPPPHPLTWGAAPPLPGADVDAAIAAALAGLGALVDEAEARRITGLPDRQ